MLVTVVPRPIDAPVRGVVFRQPPSVATVVASAHAEQAWVLTSFQLPCVDVDLADLAGQVHEGEVVVEQVGEAVDLAVGRSRRISSGGSRRRRRAAVPAILAWSWSPPGTHGDWRSGCGRATRNGGFAVGVEVRPPGVGTLRSSLGGSLFAPHTWNPRFPGRRAVSANDAIESVVGRSRDGARRPARRLTRLSTCARTAHPRPGLRRSSPILYHLTSFGMSVPRDVRTDA
jgi:hypothetical protein